MTTSSAEPLCARPSTASVPSDLLVVPRTCTSGLPIGHGMVIVVVLGTSTGPTCTAPGVVAGAVVEVVDDRCVVLGRWPMVVATWGSSARVVEAGVERSRITPG